MLNYVKHLRPARLSVFISRPHAVPVRPLSDESFERLAIYKDADKRLKELVSVDHKQT